MQENTVAALRATREKMVQERDILNQSIENLDATLALIDPAIKTAEQLVEAAGGGNKALARVRNTLRVDEYKSINRIAKEAEIQEGTVKACLELLKRELYVRRTRGKPEYRWKDPANQPRRGLAEKVMQTVKEAMPEGLRSPAITDLCEKYSDSKKDKRNSVMSTIQRLRRDGALKYDPQTGYYTVPDARA